MSDNDYARRLREIVKELVEATQDVDLLDLVYKLLVVDAQK